jgi:hypothetical protein
VDFAREGAPVVITDVDVAEGEATVHLITTQGGEARLVILAAAAVSLTRLWPFSS